MAVDVGVGDGVATEVGVAVDVGVGDGVATEVGVAVDVGVGDGVATEVGVAVDVGVGDGVATEVGVAVDVGVGDFTGAGMDVGVSSSAPGMPSIGSATVSTIHDHVLRSDVVTAIALAASSTSPGTNSHSPRPSSQCTAWTCDASSLGPNSNGM